jgi:hypothetical protein
MIEIATFLDLHIPLKYDDFSAENYIDNRYVYRM